MLDRLVGYKLSPFLWRKVRRGLSAGRVQSVAVRLIDDREKEIENFNPMNTGTWTPPWVPGTKALWHALPRTPTAKKLLPQKRGRGPRH